MKTRHICFVEYNMFAIFPEKDIQDEVFFKVYRIAKPIIGIVVIWYSQSCSVKISGVPHGWIYL